MNDGRKNFALINFIDVMSYCCRRLVEDVLCGHPDLFRFLYEDKDKSVRHFYKQLYELNLLEAHWSQCENLLIDKNLPPATRHELMRIFWQAIKNSSRHGIINRRKLSFSIPKFNR